MVYGVWCVVCVVCLVLTCECASSPLTPSKGALSYTRAAGEKLSSLALLLPGPLSCLAGVCQRFVIKLPLGGIPGMMTGFVLF